MNSTTKIIAGVAVLALLFAGIGFAVAYTAQSQSTGNTINVAYITLDDGLAADSAEAKLIGANSAIGFDTVTGVNGVVAYTLKGDAIVAGNIVLYNQNVDEETVTIEIKETGTALLTDTHFTVTIGGETASYDATKGWYADVSLASGSQNVAVKYTVISDTQFTTQELQDIVTKATFDFTIKATAGTDTP